MPTPTARLCLLTDVAHQIPSGCWWADNLPQDPAPLAHQPVLHIEGDVHLAQLDLGAPLAQGSPLWDMLQPPSANGGTGESGTREESMGDQATPALVFLIFITGNLYIDAALTSEADRSTHLLVAGNAHLRNAVLSGSGSGPQLAVQGTLQVDDLLWVHAAPLQASTPAGVHVAGDLQARVALFTGAHTPRIGGAEQVEFLIDEVRGLPHRAEFSSEIMGAVFALDFHAGIDCAARGGTADGKNADVNPGISSGEGSLGAMLDRGRILDAVRAGQSVLRSSADIHAMQPLTDGLWTGDDISIKHITAVVHSPVVAHKEYKAVGWFGQTDFALCQKHVDEEGDLRDDSVYLTVWKTWDFYLAVDESTARKPLQRIAAWLGRRAQPTAAPQLTLAYRGYANGQPGAWQALLPRTASATTGGEGPGNDTDAQAWQACQHAWRGMLDYVRKATSQHRARYPLHQRLLAEVTPARIEALTDLPVFTERYNDWWDSERNGWWEGEVWVGARQPCMYRGEPWGRALKLSWKNGQDAPGDLQDNTHSAYQLDIDEARQGPAVVEFTYAQRQSDSRTPLPRHAVDHTARLLRFYEAVQRRMGAGHVQAPAPVQEAPEHAG